MLKEEAFKWTEEEYKALKTEFNRSSFKKLLKSEKGKVCVCCGNAEGIEYHHILPLRLGGDNRLSNIQPICYSCHKVIHGGIVHKMYRKENQGGRKRVQPPKDYENILNRYITGEIGLAECKTLLGMEQQMKMGDKWWYKEYLKSHNIKTFRNNIDIINANGVMAQGREVSYVVYVDNTKEVHTSDVYMAIHEPIVKVEKPFERGDIEYKREMLGLLQRNRH